MSHDLLFTNETAWNAIDLRALFDLFGEGVVRDDDLEVTAGGTGLSVDVAAGSALVASDEPGDQGKYRVTLDTPLNSDAFTAGGLEAADGALPRVDRIVARAYDDEVDGSGLTAFRLEVVTGVPTAGATLINNNGIGAVPSSSLPLARVLVGAGAVAITAPDIADDRVVVATGGGGGTGILESIVDAKGDLLVGDGPDSVTRLPVGADDEVLIADNTTVEGVRWGTAPGFPFSIENFDNVGDLMVADGDNSVSVLPNTANDGDVLTADSGAPLGVSWDAVFGVIAAAGDLIVGLADNTPTRLAVGAAGEVLAVVGDDPTWVDRLTLLPIRESVDFNTSSLADDAEDATITLGLRASARAIMFESDVACRFRLYMTSADRAADAARPIGTDPTGDHGLLLELVTDVDLVLRLTPQVDMTADPTDATPPYGNSYYAAVTNLSGGTTVVNCTLTYIPTERAAA